MTSIDIPENPDFSFIENRAASEVLTKAFPIIQQKNGLETLATFNENSFINTKNEKIRDLLNIIRGQYTSDIIPSGQSDIWFMKHLQYLAIFGYSKYKSLYLNRIISRFP